MDQLLHPCGLLVGLLQAHPDAVMTFLPYAVPVLEERLQLEEVGSQCAIYIRSTCADATSRWLWQ